MTVVDYAWGRPSVAALKAAGAVAVCRYLSVVTDATRGKILTRDEADRLRAAGIAIVSNWEYDARDALGGYERGRTYARLAHQQHTACGGPPDRPIYFSVDWGVVDSQLPLVDAFFRGVAAELGLDRTGAYGGYRTIRHLFDQGLIRWGWQTYAWSAGAWDARAQLRQVRNGVPVDGVDCDLNETMAADFGQWGVGNGMELTTTVPGTGTPDHKADRTVGEIEHDEAQLRAILWGQVSTSVVPPGSPLARLLALPAAVEALGSREVPVALSAEQLAALGDHLAAALGAQVAELTTKVDELSARLALAGRALDA